MDTINITDKVKTYDDACKVLGINLGDYSVKSFGFDAGDSQSITAYARLIIITRALNEGWQPDWTNSRQYKYYPWFYMGSAGGGFRFDDCDYGYVLSFVGSRLCFKTRELAEYAATQFHALYSAFFTIQ